MSASRRTELEIVRGPVIDRTSWLVTASLCFLVPVSVLAGEYVAIGPVTLFRVVVAGLVVIAAWLWRREFWRQAWFGERILCGVLAIWLIVGVCSGLAAGGARWSDMVNLVIGFALAWSLGRLTTFGSITALTRGWQLSILVSLPIAIWERLTARHLPGYIRGVWRHHANTYFDPATFFVNPNYYALFLVVACPLLTLQAVRDRGWRRILDLVVLAVDLGLLAISDSRACQAGLVLMVIGALLVTRAGRFAVILACLAVVCMLAGPCQGRITALWSQWHAVSVGHEDLGTASVPVRMALFAFGLTIVTEHPWLGAGPGGFTPLAAAQRQFWLHHKVDPHNGLLQVATEYGIPMAALLVMLWLWAGWRGWRLRSQDRARAAALLALVVASPALSLANSQFIGPNVVSLWMAAVLVLIAAPATVSGEAGVVCSSEDIREQGDCR